MQSADEVVDGWPNWLVDNIPTEVLAGLVSRSADSYDKLAKVISFYGTIIALLCIDYELPIRSYDSHSSGLLTSFPETVSKILY